MVVHVVIPLKQDDEGAAEISKRLSEKSVEMVKLYQDNYKYTYFVAYDGSGVGIVRRARIIGRKDRSCRYTRFSYSWIWSHKP